ncbi:MAG: SDR family oxidoreductase [bacterium]|jgi:UDP-N-acetylglucosamine/UDP-N-acetylgalactosamine 4-epimerase
MGSSQKKILITGAAGFIGSNLVEHFLALGYDVVGMDNFATGFRHNIEDFQSNPDFNFIEGDIRSLEDCQKAVEGADFVLHQAALGSVPRSIKDPINTNSANIDGFVNMLVAARDAGVKRFVYAASSSTYGDSVKLPKVEDEIGRPLSPYAVTKLVNELYADVFSRTYGMECVGLRYFNVFGKNQTPDGAYAAVIPLWVKLLIRHERPTINGDETYSRDFTYIRNVCEANEKAMLAPAADLTVDGKEYVHQVFNVAYGGNTTLIELFRALRDNLAKEDPAIAGIEPVIGPFREGDIPHSQASIDKARHMLGYNPQYDARQGFELVAKWYYENLR